MPMPCPTYSSTMPYRPCERTYDSMAWPMSVNRPPGLAAARPRHSASSQTRISSRSSGVTSPTGTVTAESPCQPSRIAPQSIERMSPSRSTRLPGMPWTISSLTEAQMVAGNPW
ncbi:hypothetical protein TR74_20085 [Carbonactinospora thermoautotrophica]|uniref:Uncharacterized protein n=1 Tax=Carbonactinospora thermoautotrophica TaxID=1469144 RepID=A0A132NBW3_9ACTN|nr:hypothetical protein TR74_20085 [Carbonactinospora thermoautotrophica]